VKRRHFLTGLGGAALATPFLSSLEKPAKAQAPTAPRRLVIFYTNNGSLGPKWGPTTQDGAVAATELAGQTLEPISPVVSKLLFPRGIAMYPRGTINGYFDPHDQGMGSKLTCAPIDPAGSHYATQRSLDHVAAELINPGAKNPLVLSVGRAGTDVKSVISYSAANTPYPAETNPKNVYGGLTGLFQTGGMTPADYRVTQGNSIIDLVKGDLDDFKRQPMSMADTKRIDDWLTLLRETERPIVSAACNAENAAALGITDATVTAASPGTRGGFDTGTAMVQGGDMMIKLIALTMMCDANRMIMLQWPGFITFNFDGLTHTYTHHGLSHRNGDNGVTSTPDIPGVEDMIFEIDRWYGIRYGRLVNLIESIQEAEGKTMLDNSVVMWLPELNDGKQHNNDHLPIVMAGSNGGYFKQGVSVNLDTGGSTGGRGGGGFFNGGIPLNKFHATLLNSLGATDMGMPFTSFGTMDNNTSETITNPGELTALRAV
jgi:hypothetical protein